MDANAVLVTGLPPEGVTEHEVQQYMTFCGPVASVHLLPTSHLAASPAVATTNTTTPSAFASSSAAVVTFSDPSSVNFAELLSGALFHGKAIHVCSTMNAEAKQIMVHLASEPGAPERGLPTPQYLPDAATPASLHANPHADAPEAEDIPETMTGLWVRARMQRAAKAVRARTGQLMSDAREGVAKVRHGALSLELKATQVIADVREMRETVRVYGNGPTRAQYDYTPTQPQWGERPKWVRESNMK